MQLPLSCTALPCWHTSPSVPATAVVAVAVAVAVCDDDDDDDATATVCAAVAAAAAVVVVEEEEGEEDEEEDEEDEEARAWFLASCGESWPRCHSQGLIGGVCSTGELVAIPCICMAGGVMAVVGVVGVVGAVDSEDDVVLAVAGELPALVAGLLAGLAVGPVALDLDCMTRSTALCSWASWSNSVSCESSSSRCNEATSSFNRVTCTCDKG